MKKRKHEIVHYKRENEWAIRRKTEDEEQRLSYDGAWFVWTYKEEWAKRFFHEDTAVQALMVIKTRWDIKEELPRRPIQEKQSWSELS